MRRVCAVMPVGYTKIAAPVDSGPLILRLGAPFLLGAAVGTMGFAFASLPSAPTPALPTASPR